jgi:hypothetical protein
MPCVRIGFFLSKYYKKFKGSGVSPAAGPKSGQFDRSRSSEKANPPKADKYRISNNECRMSKGCILSIFKRLSKAKPSFEIPRLARESLTPDTRNLKRFIFSTTDN